MSFADATLGNRSQLPQSKDRNWNWQQTWNGVRGFVPETHTRIYTHTNTHRTCEVQGPLIYKRGSIQTIVSPAVLENRLRIKSLICSCHFEEFPHMNSNTHADLSLLDSKCGLDTGRGLPVAVIEQIVWAVCEARKKNSHTPCSQSEKRVKNRFEITQLSLFYINRVSPRALFLLASKTDRCPLPIPLNSSGFWI